MIAPSPVGRPRVVVALALLVALAVTACGVETGSTADHTLGTPKSTSSRSSNRSHDGNVIGNSSDPAATTSSTTSTTIAPVQTNVTIHGDDGSATNKTVANAIADLQAWWSTEFPKLYGGQAYTPVKGGFYAIGPDSSPVGLPCKPKSIDDVLENAYYCPEDDGVVWDQVGLMPELAKKFGSFTPAVVLAHEWGHAIQARADFSAATVIAEQQADCFAGAWVEHVKADDDPRFHITTDDLDQALAGLLSLRDTPGSTADDPNAHGSGFDRVRAFQQGYEEGAARCARYRDGDPEPFQFPYTDQADLNDNGNLPLRGTTADPGIETLTFTSLDAYWKAEFPKLSGGKAWKAMGDPKPFDPSDPPSCGGSVVSGYKLFVCIPDRYVGYDDVTTIPEIYRQGGDFAVATLFATQYGLDIEDQLGDAPSDAITSTLEGDCYAGSWAASILPGVEQPTDDGITLSPGDLDEAVGVLLSFRSAADRKRYGPGFDRVRAFGIGVTEGAARCAEVRPS